MILDGEARRLRKIERAARAYRQAEQDGTPRIYRGKALHDLGVALDAALEEGGPTRMVDAPKRIQRRRTRGWTMPAGAIVVSRPSEFANPYRISTARDVKTWKVIYMVEGAGQVWICDSKEHAHEVATAAFDAWAQLPAQRAWRNRARLALRDHDVACWCSLDMDCHGDPLLLIASQPLE